MKNKKTLAAVLAVAVLVSGTYAWQSFSQRITNETAGADGDVGARLHDDFNGINKDVYVENYASVDGGSNVYTRVRISQYFEYGTGAGTLNRADDTGITQVRGDVTTTTPDIDEKSTWDIYQFEGPEVSPTGDSIRNYQELNFGDITNSNNGAKIYMPTFNKDADDKTTADINGTLEGSDGIRGSEYKYDDYVTYSAGESVTATATYSPDSDTAKAEGSTTVEEEHAAKSTLEGSVISMEDWLDESGINKTPGAYWVYDTDGWAYWADGLAPQTATSLLLDSLSTVKLPDTDYYYGVHVEGQAYTSGDVGVEGGSTEELGIFADGVTEEALELLEIIGAFQEEVIEIKGIEILKKGDGSNDELTEYDIEVGLGGSLSLVADVDAQDGAHEVYWTIDTVSKSVTGQDLDDTLVDGVFTPVAGMEGNTYLITATSIHDELASDEVSIHVYNAEDVTVNLTLDDADGLIFMEDDGGAAVFLVGNKEIEFDISIDGLNNQDLEYNLYYYDYNDDQYHDVADVDEYFYYENGKIYLDQLVTIGIGMFEAYVEVTSKVDDEINYCYSLAALDNRTAIDVFIMMEIEENYGTDESIIEIDGEEFYLRFLDENTLSAVIIPKGNIRADKFHDTGTVYQYWLTSSLFEVTGANYLAQRPYLDSILTEWQMANSWPVHKLQLVDSEWYPFLLLPTYTNDVDYLWVAANVNNGIARAVNLETTLVEYVDCDLTGSGKTAGFRPMMAVKIFDTALFNYDEYDISLNWDSQVIFN